LVFIFLFSFIVIEFYFNFNDFFSPFEEEVSIVLENYKKTEQNFLELVRQLFRSLFLISTLLYSRKYKLSGMILLIFYAFMVSNISRSAFVIYMSLGFLNFTEVKFNFRTFSFLFILYAIFNSVSILRGDDKNAVLGNSVYTAAAYPMITLSDLNDSAYRGNAIDYMGQLLIKPFPGFLFSPFGGKPIFSFNVELTEKLGTISVNDGSPISVFTSGAPFIYYKPLYLVFFIHVFIYFIIGIFFNFIKNYSIFFYYCGISIFFLHRSNLLDIISFIILMFFTIIILTKINYKNG
jgi:hypothetical protein